MMRVSTILLIALVSVFVLSPSQIIAESTCSDIFVTFVKGSSQDSLSSAYMKDGNVLTLTPLQEKKLRDAPENKNDTDYYEKGYETWRFLKDIDDRMPEDIDAYYEEVNYPAHGKFINFAEGSFLLPDFLGTYRESQTQGVKNTINRLNEITTDCPDSYIIAGGFSQGAHVLSDAYAEIQRIEKDEPIPSDEYYGGLGVPADSDIYDLVSEAQARKILEQTLAISLFGNPRFNPELHSARGTFISENGGGLTPNESEVPDVINGNSDIRSISWCLALDPVCDSATNPGSFVYDGLAHAHYPDYAMSAAANHSVYYLMNKLGRTYYAAPYIFGSESKYANLSFNVEQDNSVAELFIVLETNLSLNEYNRTKTATKNVIRLVEYFYPNARVGAAYMSNTSGNGTEVIPLTTANELSDNDIKQALDKKYPRHRHKNTPTRQLPYNSALSKVAGNFSSNDSVPASRSIATFGWSTPFVDGSNNDLEAINLDGVSKDLKQADITTLDMFGDWGEGKYRDDGTAYAVTGLTQYASFMEGSGAVDVARTFIVDASNINKQIALHTFNNYGRPRIMLHYPVQVTAGDKVLLSVEGTYVPASDQEIVYQWDFDGDDQTDLETTTPYTEVQFAEIGQQNISVTVQSAAIDTSLLSHGLDDLFNSINVPSKPRSAKVTASVDVVEAASDISKKVDYDVVDSFRMSDSSSYDLTSAQLTSTRVASADLPNQEIGEQAGSRFREGQKLHKDAFENNAKVLGASEFAKANPWIIAGIGVFAPGLAIMIASKTGALSLGNSLDAISRPLRQTFWNNRVQVGQYTADKTGAEINRTYKGAKYIFQKITGIFK